MIELEQEDSISIIKTKYGIIGEMWYNPDETITIRICPNYYKTSAKVISSQHSDFMSVIIVGGKVS